MSLDRISILTTTTTTTTVHSDMDGAPAPAPSFNDSFVSPSVFSGSLEEEPRTWFEYLMRWQEYKDIDDVTLLKILPLILKCNSSSWYNSLTDAVRENMDQFKTAFKQKFYPSDVEKIKGILRNLEEGTKTQRKCRWIRNGSSEDKAGLSKFVGRKLVLFPSAHQETCHRI